MANVQFFFASWVSTDGDMAPGDVHLWSAWSFDYGDAFSVTATPVTGDPEQPDRTLAVEDVRINGKPDGTITLLWNVRNVGSSYIDGYGIGISWVNQ